MVEGSFAECRPHARHVGAVAFKWHILSCNFEVAESCRTAIGAQAYEARRQRVVRVLIGLDFRTVEVYGELRFVDVDAQLVPAAQRVEAHRSVRDGLPILLMLAENKGAEACIQRHLIAVEGVGTIRRSRNVDDESGYGIQVVHAEFHFHRAARQLLLFVDELAVVGRL